MGWPQFSRNSRISMPKPQQRYAHGYYEKELDQRGPVLQIGTRARTPQIHSGDDCNYPDDYKFLARRTERDDHGQVAAERDRQRCDCAAGDCQEHGPTIKKGSNLPETFADVDVQAA